MHYCQIQHHFRDCEYLCKLGKEHLQFLHALISYMQVLYFFSRQNLQTFNSVGLRGGCPTLVFGQQDAAEPDQN